jgi:hypothetical protein
VTLEAPTRKTQAGAGGAPVFYTPAEIAQILKVDPSTARRLFMDEAGVFKIGNAGRKKREYVTIRVPEAVFQRVLRERSR